MPQFSLDTTPYYQCVSRCARLAFLCSGDSHTGKSYEHRRQWIVDRIKRLADIFAIEICKYTLVSNYFHVILHVDVERADKRISAHDRAEEESYSSDLLPFAGDSCKTWPMVLPFRLKDYLELVDWTG
jgi:hypothetical protein